MTIQQNILNIKKNIPNQVKLLVVSKTQPNNQILEAYQSGQRIFGENKVQDLISKYSDLPKDIEWHFIGHLQTNKVKYIAPFISMIQSVDSLKLLSEINKEALKIQRKISCLLEIHIASEDSKYGLTLDAAIQLLESESFHSMKNIKICGVMGMATFCNDEKIIRKEFSQLHSCFTILRNKFFTDDNDFCELSMGMSGDFKIAIEQGSTLVRIGTMVFGERSYH